MQAQLDVVVMSCLVATFRDTGLSGLRTLFLRRPRKAAGIVVVRRRSTPERGFALVATLFALVLVSYLMTQLGATAHREVAIAANLRAAAQADAVAEGVVYETIFHVLKGQWTTGGLPHVVRQAPLRVVVRITDEAGKIDMNVAPLPLLTAFVRACISDDATAAHVAAAITDWRTPNLPPLPGGAKAPQYRLAGFPYGPPNERFERAAELALVLGMTPALYGCLEPHVTVYTGTIPASGSGDALVSAVLSAVYPEGANILSNTTPLPRVIRVTVAVGAPGRGQVSQTAVVRFTPDNAVSAWRVLAWE